MRKYLSMLFALLLVATISLSACAKKEEPPPPPPPPAAAPADNMMAPGAPGAPAHLAHRAHPAHLAHLAHPASSFPGSTVPGKGAGVSPAPFSIETSATVKKPLTVPRRAWYQSCASLVDALP